MYSEREKLFYSVACKMSTPLSPASQLLAPGSLTEDAGKTQNKHPLTSSLPVAHSSLRSLLSVGHEPKRAGLYTHSAGAPHPGGCGQRSKIVRGSHSKRARQVNLIRSDG